MRRILIWCLAILVTVFVTACSQETPPEQQAAKPAGKEAKQAPMPAKPSGEEAMPKAEKEAAAVKEETPMPAETVKEQAEVVTEEAKTTAAESMENTQQAAPPEMQGPEVVTYDASKGKVTFNHADHAGRLDCGKCHTTDPPQKIALNMGSAHKLCRGCHQEMGGNAPQVCSGCHQKE